MSYQKDKPCKYGCNKTVTWRGKSGKPGSTGYYEVGTTIEHTYDRCIELKANGGGQTQLPQQKSYQPNHQARISTASPAPSSTFSRDEEPKAQGVTIYSLHTIMAEQRKDIKELRKQIETLASIVDSTAQKTELLINKVGYPAPEIIKEPKPVVEEIKTQQRHPTQEELNEVINPMRVAKEEVPKSEMLTGSDIMEWQNISEAFVCHNCSGKCHNGYMKLGTKLCPNCKDSVESNESEDDRSDVNNYKPRSIEDINEDL